MGDDCMSHELYNLTIIRDNMLQIVLEQQTRQAAGTGGQLVTRRRTIIFLQDVLCLGGRGYSVITA